MAGNFSDKSNLNLAPRVNVAFAIIILVVLILIFRLWYLQVIKGDDFRIKSDNNRLRRVYVPPPRGLIFDRNGEVLARNRPSFNVELVLEDSPNPTSAVEALAKLIGADSETLLRQLKDQRKRRVFEPKLLMKDISRDTLAQVSVRRNELPGIITSVYPTREYLHGDLAAHVLGYIREISPNQMKNPKFATYMMNDVVGQFGIESRWESLLQGQRGTQLVYVNVSGTKVGEASYEPEKSGHNVSLTLDLDVQRAADLALKDKAGAIVAINPQTGELLALSSAPTFDPNVFSGPLSGELWDELVKGKKQPLTNRAVQGAYHPGSVFKIIMLTAALSERVMDLHDTVFCKGGIQVGRRFFHCHKKSGHGVVDYKQGLIQSCDVYYYLAGQRLGVDRIHQYATAFGLGRPTGIELSDENPGLIPSTEWKKRAYKKPEDQKWYPGETPSVAIGQGAVTTTPLQIAVAVSAVLNGGKLYKPQLIKKVESPDGSFRDTGFGPEVYDTVTVEPWVTAAVRESMKGVVNDPRGTGKNAKMPDFPKITVAGKTGTAQVVSLEAAGDKEHFEDHAWFVGYAPEENPEIVVVALIENGGHGGTAAAPAVRETMEAYFKKYHSEVND